MFSYMNSINNDTVYLSKEIFKKSLSDYGSSLTSEAEIAFKALFKCFEDGLKGRLLSKFYLSSIDTGLGKTLAVISFLKALKFQNKLNDGGILIGVQTKDEIWNLIKSSGLDDNDFAILVYNDELNGKGRGEDGRNEAPVLFTTQQMIRSRAQASFLGASDFYYRGRPRNLRIWDESMIPATPISFSVDDLTAIISRMRSYEPHFIGNLEYYLRQLQYKKAGDMILIPEELASHAKAILTIDGKGISKLSDTQKTALQGFSQTDGQEMLVTRTKRTGMSLSGAISPLPDNLAPAIILDASGRLKSTYNLWEGHRGNLIRLPSAVNKYNDVTINLWKTSVGKDALADPDISRTIFRQIAKLIEAKPDEPWLIISFKDGDNFDVLEEVKASLPIPLNSTADLRYVYWGKHAAINDHADVKNIIMVGSWLYPQSAYKSLYHAATGYAPEEEDQDDLKTLRQTEFQSNFLQAFMRGHGRRSRNGHAGECEAYVIVSRSPNPEPLIAAALPGCIIKPWMPVKMELTGQAKDAAAFLKQQKEAGVGRVAKSAIDGPAGITTKQRRTAVITSFLFKEWLEENGIEVAHRDFLLND